MRLPTTSWLRPASTSAPSISLTITTRCALVGVVRVEVAAGDQRDPHRGEVSRRDRSRLRRQALPVGLRMIFDLDAAAVVVAAERQDVHRADVATRRACARRAPRAADRTASGRLPRSAPSAATTSIVSTLFGREAGVDLLQLPQAANQQPGADQQHDRQRDFGDDQRFARAAADGCALLLAAFLQRVVEILSSTGAAPASSRRPRWSASDAASANTSTGASMPI